MKTCLSVTMEVRDLGISVNWIWVTLIPHVFVVKEKANKMGGMRRRAIRHNKSIFFITLRCSYTSVWCLLDTVLEKDKGKITSDICIVQQLSERLHRQYFIGPSRTLGGKTSSCPDEKTKSYLSRLIPKSENRDKTRESSLGILVLKLVFLNLTLMLKNLQRNRTRMTKSWGGAFFKRFF